MPSRNQSACMDRVGRDQTAARIEGIVGRAGSGCGDQ
jgi:hypothetical protein